MSDTQASFDFSLTPEYASWLKDLKAKIRSVQIKAALAASRELILFYWELGESISRKLAENNWGAKVVDKLSKDLSAEFPGIQGFSRRNLYYVKKFYEFFIRLPDVETIVPPPGAQFDPAIVPRGEARTIPWIVQQIGGQLEFRYQYPNLACRCHSPGGGRPWPFLSSIALPF